MTSGKYLNGELFFVLSTILTYSFGWQVPEIRQIKDQVHGRGVDPTRARTSQSRDRHPHRWKRRWREALDLVRIHLALGQKRARVRRSVLQRLQVSVSSLFFTSFHAHSPSQAPDTHILLFFVALSISKRQQVPAVARVGPPSLTSTATRWPSRPAATPHPRPTFSCPSTGSSARSSTSATTSPSHAARSRPSSCTGPLTRRDAWD